ncbi:MAG: hypothetical protein CVV18_05880 [Gammaproteobacteria bacterium HGW-Gammaproteobacteria-8]|nr:MAG: hypothetical protein CVV18_05880 [Gammaproteobacteria bacterium HGW-Gammaproteobacteria-8]
MLMRIMLAGVLSVALASCATTTKTERLASPEDPFAMPIQEFLDEQQILLANLEQGYPRELDEFEWKRLNRITDNITELVGDAQEIEEIDLDTRYTLFQLRTQMVAMLVGGTAEDVVCFRQQLTGTRLGNKRRCMTRAELEQSRFYSDYVMEFIRQLPQGLETN